MWKMILVPHDFSASANHALAIARDEAKLHHGTILLLHVVELPPHFAADMLVMTSGSEPPIGMRQYAVASASKHLDDLEARLEKDGVTVTSFVRVGAPVEEIKRLVGEQGVDVIVMGTHGRTGLRHLVAGSVAERVVRTSEVPVMTIRHPD